MVEVKYISWGIGCRIGDTIYLNQALKSYPELHNVLLKHELDHTSGFCIQDIMMDISNPHLQGRKLQYYLFLFKNPSTLTEFSPIWRYEGKLIINPLLLGFYGIILGAIGLIGGLL